MFAQSKDLSVLNGWFDKLNIENGTQKLAFFPC